MLRTKRKWRRRIGDSWAGRWRTCSWATSTAWAPPLPESEQDFRHWPRWGGNDIKSYFLCQGRCWNSRLACLVLQVFMPSLIFRVMCFLKRGDATLIEILYLPQKMDIRPSTASGPSSLGPVSITDESGKDQVRVEGTVLFWSLNKQHYSYTLNWNCKSMPLFGQGSKQKNE